MPVLAIDNKWKEAYDAGTNFLSTGTKTGTISTTAGRLFLISATIKIPISDILLAIVLFQNVKTFFFFFSPLLFVPFSLLLFLSNAQR